MYRRILHAVSVYRRKCIRRFIQQRRYDEVNYRSVQISRLR